MRTMREITHYLPLQLTWTKQHLPPERAWVAEDCLCTKNIAITPSELGDWNPHLSHHQTVQLQVKNSLMFIIWIKEMVFSPQDQSQGWIRTRREEKAFQKVGIGTQGKVLQIEEMKKASKGWRILVCFLESRAKFSTRGRRCKHRWIIYFFLF